MCMNTVDQIYDPPLEEERVGYKVMRKTYLSPATLRGWACATEYEHGRWYQASRGYDWMLSISCDKGIIYDNNGAECSCYPFGFHCCVTLLDAVLFRARQALCSDVIVQVRYRKVVAAGSEKCCSTTASIVVAKEMLIKRVLTDETVIAMCPEAAEVLTGVAN